MAETLIVVVEIYFDIRYIYSSKYIHHVSFPTSMINELNLPIIIKLSVYTVVTRRSYQNLEVSTVAFTHSIFNVLQVCRRDIKSEGYVDVCVHHHWFLPKRMLYVVFLHQYAVQIIRLKQNSIINNLCRKASWHFLLSINFCKVYEHSRKLYCLLDMMNLHTFITNNNSFS